MSLLTALRVVSVDANGRVVAKLVNDGLMFSDHDDQDHDDQGHDDQGHDGSPGLYAVSREMACYDVRDRGMVKTVLPRPGLMLPDLRPGDLLVCRETQGQPEDDKDDNVSIKVLVTTDYADRAQLDDFWGSSLDKAELREAGRPPELFIARDIANDIEAFLVASMVARSALTRPVGTSVRVGGADEGPAPRAGKDILFTAFKTSVDLDFEASAVMASKQPNAALILAWRGARAIEADVLYGTGPYFFWNSDNGSSCQDMGLDEPESPGLWYLSNCQPWSSRDWESGYVDDYGLDGDLEPVTPERAAELFGMAADEVLALMEERYPYHHDDLPIMQAIAAPEGDGRARDLVTGDMAG